MLLLILSTQANHSVASIPSLYPCSSSHPTTLCNIFIITSHSLLDHLHWHINVPRVLPHPKEFSLELTSLLSYPMGIELLTFSTKHLKRLVSTHSSFSPLGFFFFFFFLLNLYKSDFCQHHSTKLLMSASPVTSSLLNPMVCSPFLLYLFW